MRPARSWSGWRRGSARAAASRCPSPTCAPYEVVAEEKTSWLARVRQAVRGRHHLPAGGHGARLRRHRVRRRRARSFLFLAVNRGYSAGVVFALTAWAGVVASAVYLLNAFFGDRFERRWTQLVGAVLFAGGWWGMYEVHSTAGVDTFYIIANVGAILWLWSMYVYIPNNYPTRMRVAGHRLDRRRRPPRRLGRRPDRRAALHRDRAAELHLVHHDPVRAPPRRPDRDLREEPAPPRAGRTVPIDAGPPAGLLGRRLFPEVSPAANQGVTGGPALTTAGLPSCGT